MQIPAFEFRSPPLLRVGRGVFAQAGEQAAAVRITRALLVVDPHHARTGRAQGLADLCRQAGVETATYAGVDAEPLVRHIDEGLAEARRLQADGVIALGGGSAMDAAKAVAAMATNPGRIADYMVPARFPVPRLPLLCLPSTAGTGSEVTRNTIITDPDTQVKMLIADPQLVPDAALDDPELTDSCPPAITAATGLDALTHALEAYVSRRANPYSSLLALSALRRIATYLPRAYADGADQIARDQMMLGQLEAGLAFSNASVCLVHGMARPLGAYFHVPHGLANAVLLPTVMAWSAPAAATAYAEIARALGCAPSRDDLTTAQAGAAAVAALCHSLHVPTLAETVGGAEKIRAVAAQMAKDALASGSPGNNPRVPSADEIVALYAQAMGE